MKPGDARELVRTISESDNDKTPELIQGTVSAVGSTTVDVDFGLGAVTGLAYLSGYHPKINDTIWALRNGADYLVLGVLYPHGAEQINALEETALPSAYPNGITIFYTDSTTPVWSHGYGQAVTIKSSSPRTTQFFHRKHGGSYVRHIAVDTNDQWGPWQLLTNYDWILPSLLNGWVNYGGGFAGAAYREEGGGVVRITGLVKSGSSGTTVFTLPTKLRPSAHKIFACQADGGTARVDVKSTGEVLVGSSTQGAGNPTNFLSLSGIVFGLG